jgi:hypothetical protein
MKKFLAMAAIALFTLTSCSEDDAAPITNNPQENPIETVLLKKIITTSISNSTINLINYDSQNRITTIMDENGNVRSEYTYAGNKIVKIESNDQDGNLFMRRTFDYDSAGKLNIYKKILYGPFIEASLNTTKRTYTYNQDGTVSSTEFTGDENEQTWNRGTVVLTMENGNIIMEAKTVGTETTIRNYTFDTKNNPYKNVPGVEALALADYNGGVNNTTFSGLQGDEMNDITFTYTYNADNYPVTSVLSTWAGAAIVTTQYFYE